MKKILSLALCGVLLLTSLLAFAGCSTEKKIIGTWEATLDMTEFLNEEMALDEGMSEYFTVSDFAFVLHFTFNDDGTYKIAIDEDALAATIDSLKDDLAVGMTEYFEDVIVSSGLSITVEEMLSYSGMDMDELMDESINAEMFDEIVSDFVTEGNYEFSEGNLYTSADFDSEIDKDEYITVAFSGKDIKFVSLVTDEEPDEMTKKLFPMTLKKIG